MKVAKTLLRPEAQQAWAFAGLALSIAGALAAVVPANAGRRKAEQEWMAAQKRRLAMERQELPPLPTRMAFSPSEPQEPARIVSLVRAMASVSECRLTAFELSTTGQRDAAALVWPERIQLELTGPFPRIREFLVRLQRSDRLLVVPELTVEREGGGAGLPAPGGADNGVVKATLQVERYVAKAATVGNAVEVAGGSRL